MSARRGASLLLSVPTKKKIVAALFDEEQMAQIEEYVEERNRLLRRSEFSGHRLTANTAVAQLAMAALVAGVAVPSSVTVERTMKKPTPPTKRAKTAQAAKVADEPKRRGPKPGSGSKENLTLSLDKRVVQWLKSLPDGASPTANAVLLRAYQRRASSK